MGTNKKKKQTTTPPKKKTTTPTSKKKTITTPPKKKATTAAKNNQPKPGPTPRRRKKVVKPKPHVQAEPPPNVVQPTAIQPTPSPDVVPQVRLTRIDEFFSDFPEFEYNPHSHPSSEFRQLSQEKSWDWDDEAKFIPQEAWDARRDFRSALVSQFNETYGTEENSLAAWQGLCEVLQYDDIPNTLGGCRALVMSTHVNLVDLLAYQNTGEQVHKFPSEVALSKYTIDTGKYFPREDANFGSLLKRLRRHILNPSLGRRGGSHSMRRNGTLVGGRGRGRGRGGR